MRSEKFSNLTQNELREMIEPEQIVYISYLLDKDLSKHKLLKLYSILFQLAASHCDDENLRDFLCSHNFAEKLSKSKLEKVNLG